MQVSNLVQQGCMLQAHFIAQGRQNYCETITSQMFTINNVVTFQMKVIQTFHNIQQVQCSFGPRSIGNEHHIIMNFTKKHKDDRKNYILKLSSKALNINSKCYKNDDGSWYIIHKHETSHSTFDITAVLETVKVTSEESFASFAGKIHDDDVLADFELRCEDGSVKVHKAVLAMSSPVLRRELQGDWLETKQGCVNIPHIPRATLQHFKDYMYLRVLPDSGTEQLLLLASYYMMPELEQKCVEKLRATVNAHNALSLLDFGRVHQMTKLQLAVLECIESGKVKVNDIEKQVGGKRLTEN